VKRARLLSQNQIRDIVMDSDSDEEKYSGSEDTEDEPRPPSRWSSISQPPSPDFFTTQKTTFKTSFRRSPWKMLEPRPQCK
jgi:hypothetical protein